MTLITVFLTLLVSFLSTKTARAQDNHIDVDALTAQTQKMLTDADRITMVWWIPDEYWQASFAQNPAITKAQMQSFTKALSPYILFVVVDGKIGSLGRVTYKSEETIRSTIQLIDSHKTIYYPLSKESIGADAKTFLSVMKPVFSNMMGQLGENMNFVVFPSSSKTREKIADARGEGSFSLKLGESMFKWKVPLGAVLPAKVCPIDGEQLNGAWKFCPEHGKELLQPSK